MGVLSERKKITTNHPPSVSARVRDDSAASANESTLVDVSALLPSPPAPCHRCGMAILWLPTTLDAWRCPTCFPPPVKKMVACRVVLVDVPQYQNEPPRITPQWHKLSWIERDGRKSLQTTPIRCGANGTALVDAVGDAGGVGFDGTESFANCDSDATGAKLGALNAMQNFVQDDQLGPPLVDGVRQDDDEWFDVGAKDEVWKQFFESKNIINQQRAT